MDEYEFTVRWKSHSDKDADLIARRMRVEVASIGGSGREITSLSLQRIRVVEERENIPLVFGY